MFNFTHVTVRDNAQGGVNTTAYVPGSGYVAFSTRIKGADRGCQVSAGVPVKRADGLILGWRGSTTGISLDEDWGDSAGATDTFHLQE